MHAENKRSSPPAWLAAPLLVLLVVSAYWPAVKGDFIWDDDINVQTPVLGSPRALQKIWTVGNTPQFYPLTFTSFWIERQLWGLNPAGYHLTNIALHAANAVLVWLVLLQLGLPGAWLAAAIFAVHPVHVESVAWITERKNVLSALFYLLSLAGYLRFERSRQRRWYWTSLALFGLALLSKTAVCTLPVVLLLLRWKDARPLGKSELKATVPFFLLALAAGLVTVYVEKGPAGGARGPQFDSSAIERLLVAGRALWFYAGKLAWPANLSFNYERWSVDARDPSQWAGALAALSLALFLWRRRDSAGRAPLAALAFFVVTLAPALGLISLFYQRYSFVADHFQYLASLGLIALAAGAAERLASRRLAAVLAACALAALATATWRQARVYRGLEPLWRDVLAKNPGSFLAHDNVAAALSAQGKLEEAAARYLEALRLKPDFAESHSNLANVFNRLGRYEEAARHAREAVRHQPDFADAHNNLADALAGQRKLDEAAYEFRRAIELRPHFVAAHVNLGKVLFLQGKLPQAVDAERRALALDPSLPEAYNNLGTLAALQGRLKQARVYYSQALSLRPGFAAASLGLADVLADQGQNAQAISQYRKTLSIDPGYAAAHEHLAVVLARVGDHQGALQSKRAAESLRTSAPKRRGS